jgi:ribose transport system substrate-binding protein
MTKMKTLKRCAVAALLLATAIPAQAQDISIAGAIMNTQDPFWTTVGCGAKAKGAELGVKVDIFSSTTMDAKEFSANVNAALLAKPNGFFATPGNPAEFATQFGDLMKSGVPVVTGFGTDPAAQYKIVWSSGDTKPYIDELLKLITVDSGQMVVMGGIQGIKPLEDRYEPLVAAVKQAKPGLAEIERIYSFFDVNKGTAALSAAMIANPDLKLIVASNGPDGIAAASAVKAAGKVGQVLIVAFDAVPPEVDSLKEGTITALVAQSPAQIGASSVQVMVDYLKSGASGAVPVSTDMIGIPQRLLTKENVGDPANADYIYKPEC